MTASVGVVVHPNFQLETLANAEQCQAARLFDGLGQALNAPRRLTLGHLIAEAPDDLPRAISLLRNPLDRLLHAACWFPAAISRRTAPR